MINLRYHIVSLVAVFLALAIGIFTGSTLLDRATVDYLKASRDRVDDRNKELRAENDSLRAAAEAADRTDEAFLADALGPLVEGRLEDRHVLVVATRGIDEAVVDRLAKLVARAGADGLGVLWLDERTDLLDPESLAAITAYRDQGQASTTTVDGDTTDVAQLWVADLAVALGALDRQPPLPTTTTTSTTTVVVGPGVTTDAPPAELAGPARQDAGLVGELVAGGLADWTDPTGVRDEPPRLPDEELSVVVLSGEGAVVPAGTTMEPLIRALVAQGGRVVFGEVRRPRTIAQEVDSEDVPDRGRVVDELRADDDLVASLATVDDVDAANGTTALLLVLAGPDGPVSGKYGEAPSAERRFPASE